MSKQRGVMGVLSLCVLFSMTAALPTQSTTTIVPSPQNIDFNQAAVFTCFDESFQGNPLGILFPPSDDTISLINNITIAAIGHRDTVDKFCAVRQAYIQCVQKVLRNPIARIDKLIGVYLDAEKFGQAFNLYCDNSAFIQNQFECTYNATFESPCMVGGVSGMIDQIYSALIGNFNQQQFCATMLASIQCRVECQLQVCDQNYGSVMNDFYYNLIENYCPRQTSVVPMACQS